MARDLRSSQVRTNKIIGSGSIIYIYPSGSGSDYLGTLPTGVSAGSDTSLYISGTIGGKGSGGVTVIGGDTQISGTLYLGDEKRLSFGDANNAAIFWDEDGSEFIRYILDTHLEFPQFAGLYITGSDFVQGTDSTGSNIIIVAGDSSGSVSSGAGIIMLLGGNAKNTGKAGGDILLIGGYTTGSTPLSSVAGGNIELTGGEPFDNPGTKGDGGMVQIFGGTPTIPNVTGSGGDVIIESGMPGTSGSAGNLYLIGGQATEGGNAQLNAGNIIIAGGFKTGIETVLSGNSGNVYIGGGVNFNQPMGSIGVSGSVNIGAAWGGEAALDFSDISYANKQTVFIGSPSQFTGSYQDFGINNDGKGILVTGRVVIDAPSVQITGSNRQLGAGHIFISGTLVELSGTTIGISGSSFGLYGVPPIAQPGGWEVGSYTAASRSLDVVTTDIPQIVQVLSTLISDLRSLGILSASIHATGL